MSPGPIIAALTITTTIAIIAIRIYTWMLRWSSDVRFEDVSLSPLLAASIDDACEIIQSVITRNYPYRPELTEFRVIIRPRGTLGYADNGARLGGTVKTERMFPVTERVFVAIVQEVDAPYFIAHEVARHILPMRIYDDADSGHTLKEFALVEQEMKDKIARKLRGVA